MGTLKNKYADSYRVEFRVVTLGIKRETHFTTYFLLNGKECNASYIIH